MRSWTAKEVVFLLIANILVALFTRFTPPYFSQFISHSSGVLFCLFLAIPLIFSAATSFYLKKRNMKLYILVWILVCLEVFHIILARNLSFATKISEIFTGHYNVEDTGFSLLYAILYCGLLLVGCGVGCSVWRHQQTKQL